MRTLEERIERLEKKIFKEVKLGNKEIGDTFELAGKTWKVLDKFGDKTLVWCLDNLGNRTFGSDNYWTDCSLRIYLHDEVLPKIKDEIGQENICGFARDLISLDGQTEYGTTADVISLLTIDEYRKYRHLIPNQGDYWWLCSPDSTKCNNDDRWIEVVSPSGNLSNRNCNGSFGVRPVLYLKSSIFES